MPLSIARTVGVPKGCVARPAVAAPVTGTVVYCKKRGVPQRLHYAMTACGTKLTCHPSNVCPSRPVNRVGRR